MIIANRETLLGALVLIVEWRLLLALAAAPNVAERGKARPALRLARVRSFYDGTLFYKRAKGRA